MDLKTWVTVGGWLYKILCGSQRLEVVQCGKSKYAFFDDQNEDELAISWCKKDRYNV